MVVVGVGLSAATGGGGGGKEESSLVVEEEEEKDAGKTLRWLAAVVGFDETLDWVVKGVGARVVVLLSYPYDEG